MAPALLLPVSGASAAASGELDPTFGAGGKVQAPFVPESFAGGVAVQADGKILTVGTPGESEGFSVARLLSNGSPDPSWGEGGVVTTHLGKFASALDVAVQPDGKIVGGGYGVDSVGVTMETVIKFELVRYLSNGELDPSFGSGGFVGVRLPSPFSFGRKLALDANGKLILGGTYDANPNPLEENEAPALMRFNSNGSLDSSFGNGGIVIGALGAGIEEESIEGLALQPDGKIVTSGSRFAEPGGSSVVVSRYIADFEKPPVPVPSKKVNLPPHSRIKGVPHKVQWEALKGFHGTASDPDGTVSKVQVSLVRLPSGGKAGTSVKVKPKKWRTAKGTAKWTLKLKRPLAPGRYVVFSRAIDNQDLAETEFSRRAGNRRAFRVLAEAR